MSAFLVATLKHIVTIGFVCGLLSLILKVLDEKLTESSKKGFDHWVDGIALQTAEVRLDAFYRWARNHQVIYGLINVLFVGTIVWLIALPQGGEDASEHVENLVFLFLFLFTLI